MMIIKKTVQEIGCGTAGRGGFAPPPPFRPLSRRSGRFPALPNPPLR